MWDLLKSTFSEFSEDECMTMGASLAYYTIFSLPSLLILIVMIAGLFWSAQDVTRLIQDQVGAFIGPSGVGQIQAILENARRPGSSGPMIAIASLAVLVFGATGAFAQLQSALNRAWEVEPDPDQGGVKIFLFKRVLSFGMILAMVFLLIVSLVVSALISRAGELAGQFIPGFSSYFLMGLDFTISILVLTLLFAAIFKWLPDAEIAWKDVGIGALVTAALFSVGKFGISFYLGRADPGSAFGAAGSLVVLMAWVYYASLILFLGAEFTQVWTKKKGRAIRPEKGALKVIRKRRRADSWAPSQS